MDQPASFCKTDTGRWTLLLHGSKNDREILGQPLKDIAVNLEADSMEAPSEPCCVSGCVSVLTLRAAAPPSTHTPKLVRKEDICLGEIFRLCF